MQIIVTHDLSDFDALASCVAAQKLYPEARIVLGRRLGRQVRDFLALHKDRFPALRHEEIDQERVSHLIVVDVRRKSRLADFARVVERAEAGAPDLEVTVFDHHASARDDLPAHHENVAKVGSATTLLVEELEKRGGRLDRVEATLLALGIHADTGSLSYAGTTARDARALAWVLDQGVELKMLARYLRPSFSAAQRGLLKRVIAESDSLRVGGLEVGFCALQAKRAVDGQAEVVTEALELLGVAALFLAFAVGERKLMLTARSRSNLIDVAALLTPLGGGGHPAAAAALLKHGDGRAALGSIRERLLADPPHVTWVGDVMSSPVHSVEHDVVLAELDRSLAVWRHTGAPVLREGKLVGIVSRRDVERARQRGDLTLPVSSCMSHSLQTTTPNTALNEALAQMVEADVGRLPVLDADRLVGIVTRSDVLAVLYDADR